MWFDILIVLGWYFDFLNFEGNQFDIEVIVYVLLYVCCFVGYMWEFYLVVQYSVFVSQIVFCQMWLVGLFYDVVEVFFGDVIKLLK